MRIEYPKITCGLQMKANKLASYKKCPKSCHSHHSGTKVVLTSFQTFLCDVNSKHGIQIVHIHV